MDLVLAPALWNGSRMVVGESVWQVGRMRRREGVVDVDNRNGSELYIISFRNLCVW